MKHVSFFILLCLIAIPVLAEQVSVVTFNPSRLGEYQHLKVTDSVKLRGGLATPQFFVNSGNMLLDNKIQVEPEQYILFGEINGASENVSFSMPQAIFSKTATTSSYSAAGGAPAANLLIPTVTTTGGEMIFSNDSFVNQLTTQGSVLLQAGTLNVSGDVSIGGDYRGRRGGVSILNADGTAPSTLGKEFKLGRYKIPYPLQVHHRGVNNTSYVPLSAADYANFALQWVERKRTDGTPVRVLALVGEISSDCNEAWVEHEDQVKCWDGHDTAGEGWTGYATRKYRTRCSGGEHETQYWDPNTEEWFTPTTEEEIFATDDQTNCHKYCWVSMRGENEYYASHWVTGNDGLQETECKGLTCGTWGTCDYSVVFSIEGTSNPSSLSCESSGPGGCSFTYCGSGDYKIIIPDPDRCSAEHVNWTS